jgi:hypothetical protein
MIRSSTFPFVTHAFGGDRAVIVARITLRISFVLIFVAASSVVLVVGGHPFHPISTGI